MKGPLKQALSIAALLTAMSSLQSGQTPPDAVRAAAAKAELRKMWNELNEAWRTRDEAALERIYADEFVFVHGQVGGALNRAEHIKQGMSLPASQTIQGLPMPDFEKIQLYGDVAVLRLLLPNRLQTAIYVKRQDRWRILHQQGSVLPGPQQTFLVDRKVLESYAGRYEQAPGRVATVTVEADGLRIVFPNRLTWALRPKSEDHFFVPDSLNQIMFHRAENGRVRYYTAFPLGDIIKGTKID